MSIRKGILEEKNLVEKILYLYLEDERKPTIESIATELGETYHNIMYVLGKKVDPFRYKAEKALRWSRSKAGDNCPMKGRTGEKHPNWKGIISDNKGHYTIIVEGTRYFYHRVVMAKMLGIHPSQLPENLIVHHIDEDPSNNDPENLALCTRGGHRKLHRKWEKLRYSPIWEKWKSTISQSETMNPLQ